VETLKPGDIVAVKGSWYHIPLMWLAVPFSDRIHFLLICGADGGDYNILEYLVLGGFSTGRLSKYRNKHCRVYRVSEDTGQLAVKKASTLETKGYDHLSVARLIGTAFWYRVKNRGPIPYCRLSRSRNDHLTCTEFVRTAYEEFCELIPVGVAATPSAFEQAYIDDKLELVYEGVLKK